MEECTTLPHAEMERQFKKLDAIWLAPFKEFLPRITAIFRGQIIAAGKRYNGSSGVAST